MCQGPAAVAIASQVAKTPCVIFLGKECKWSFSAFMTFGRNGGFAMGRLFLRRDDSLFCGRRRFYSQNVWFCFALLLRWMNHQNHVAVGRTTTTRPRIPLAFQKVFLRQHCLCRRGASPWCASSSVVCPSTDGLIPSSSSTTTSRKY